MSDEKTFSTSAEKAGCAECPFHQWREDFPIRWENDHYVSRRELARFLTVGSALLAGANGVMVAVHFAARKRDFPARRVASITQLAQLGTMLFRYPTERDPCILIRDEDGKPHAYSQVCTHLSCAVVFRADENVLYCPCHHGYFETREGRPIQGPPTRALPRILLEVRGDDVYAVGVEI